MASIERIAKELGGSAGLAARYLLNLGLKWQAGERPERPPTEHAFFPAPLLAEDVGAGAPRLRMIPGADRRYGFREDWLKDFGWTPANPERFGVYRLADAVFARSMEPTIQPGSILLVDREADRDNVPPRSVWIVSHGAGLACKRVTVRDGWLVLESDNREPEFAPEVLRLTSSARRTLLEGRVVWWATTVE